MIRRTDILIANPLHFVQLEKARVKGQRTVEVTHFEMRVSDFVRCYVLRC